MSIPRVDVAVHAQYSTETPRIQTLWIETLQIETLHTVLDCVPDARYGVGTGKGNHMAHQLTRVEKRITSAESWYPTVNGQVKVSLLGLSNGQIRVCVWGGDDFGLERDFPQNERQAARELYDLIKNGTTQAQMRAWGMGPV